MPFSIDFKAQSFYFFLIYPLATCQLTMFFYDTLQPENRRYIFLIHILRNVCMFLQNESDIYTISLNYSNSIFLLFFFHIDFKVSFVRLNDQWMI